MLLTSLSPCPSFLAEAASPFPLADTLTYTYDAVGNLLSAANSNGTYTLSYDAANRVTGVLEPFGQRLTFSYDAVGNRTVVKDSLGGVQTSLYDAANRLTSQPFAGISTTALREDLTYTAVGQEQTAIRYSNLAGTTKVGSTTYTYDADNRLSNLQHFNGSGTSLANYTYTYDNASRVQTEVLNGATTTYTYDNVNELTADGINTYTYDGTGNRNSTGYTTGTGNQLTNDGTWTYTYDAAGNLIKKSKGPSAETWTYGYDNRNELTSANKASTDGGVAILEVAYKQRRSHPEGTVRKSVSYPSRAWTTSACVTSTSVRLSSRPSWGYVSRVWSSPRACSKVACRSETRTMSCTAR
jgi:YD repeat-containing protein